MRTLLRSAWARLSLYIPVVLMGLLALSTYWLVRSTPALVPTAAPGPARHEPDYFMQNFSVRTFGDSGRLKTEVLGTQARHYPDSDTLEIDAVRIRSFDLAGRLTTASAQQALANGDVSEIQLSGNARVVRQASVDAAGKAVPELAYQGEFLHAFIDSERVRSHLPVQLTAGNDRFTADAMDYENAERVIALKGRVRGVLAATRRN
ncbi:MAG: LPS export ABC transporter periplasmic protein LptC [Rhodoferax sp.]|nr:LPS export ABC transporter periplasmic protein LptC [Rhodoferax sp.]